MEKPPEHCPGIESDNAGKSSACEGCPNKSICSSGQLSSGPDPDVAEIARKLFDVKHIIIVMSGKGGVGKSTVSTVLSRALALNPSVNVGLLDVDICGPSIPKTMGIEGEEVHQSSSGWSPIYIEDNLSVMSGGLLLGSLDDAVIWRGPKKNGLIKQFLRDVDWGPLEYLIIDTPPGTSDEHLSIVSYLKQCSNLRGVVIVSTPQEIALMDVRKQIDFCKRVNLNVLGVVENMSGFVCPKCKHESVIFRASSGGTQKLLTNGIELLARIPLHPLVGKTCDEGESIFQYKESPVAQSFIDFANNLIKILDKY